MKPTHLISKEPYYYQRWAQIESNEQYFILKPKEYPWGEVLFTNVVFFIVGGIATFLAFKNSGNEEILKKMIFPLFTLILSIGYSTITTFYWKREYRKPPMFIFDKKRKVIELPKENIELEYNPSVYFQIVLGYVGPSGKRTRVSELQLVDASNERRFCILASGSSFSNAFDYILNDLYNQTHIKIKGGKKKWN